MCPGESGFGKDEKQVVWKFEEKQVSIDKGSKFKLSGAGEIAAMF
jgi:hypothetical protein